MAENYAQQKFYQAVQALVGEGPLRKRLYEAAMSLSCLQESDFQRSPEIGEKWRQVMHDLSHVEAGPDDDGDFNATLRNMTDEEAGRLAVRILSVFFHLTGGWRS